MKQRTGKSGLRRAFVITAGFVLPEKLLSSERKNIKSHHCCAVVYYLHGQSVFPSLQAASGSSCRPLFLDLGSLHHKIWTVCKNCDSLKRESAPECYMCYKEPYVFPWGNLPAEKAVLKVQMKPSNYLIKITHIHKYHICIIHTGIYTLHMAGCVFF